MGRQNRRDFRKISTFTFKIFTCMVKFWLKIGRNDLKLSKIHTILHVVSFLIIPLNIKPEKRSPILSNIITQCIHFLSKLPLDGQYCWGCAHLILAHQQSQAVVILCKCDKENYGEILRRRKIYIFQSLMLSKNNSEIVQKNIFILPFATPR